MIFRPFFVLFFKREHLLLNATKSSDSALWWANLELYFHPNIDGKTLASVFSTEQHSHSKSSTD